MWRAFSNFDHIKFKDFIHLYADFECELAHEQQKKKKKLWNVQKHQFETFHNRWESHDEHERGVRKDSVSRNFVKNNCMKDFTSWAQKHFVNRSYFTQTVFVFSFIEIPIIFQSVVFAQYFLYFVAIFLNIPPPPKFSERKADYCRVSLRLL